MSLKEHHLIFFITFWIPKSLSYGTQLNKGITKLLAIIIRWDGKNLYCWSGTVLGGYPKYPWVSLRYCNMNLWFAGLSCPGALFPALLLHFALMFHFVPWCFALMLCHALLLCFMPCCFAAPCCFARCLNALSRPVTSHHTMPWFFILQPAASPHPIHFVLHPATSLPTLFFPFALLLCLANSPCPIASLHLVVSSRHVAPLSPTTSTHLVASHL